MIIKMGDENSAFTGPRAPLNMERNQLIRELFKRAEPYLKARGDFLHTRIAHEYALLLLEKEEGNNMIVEPAVILHDVGWSRLKSEEIKVAYRVMASGENAAKLNRVHEVEGAIIAQEILEQIGYDHSLIEKVTQIIERHDSGESPETIEECIVKDADKLWRFSRVGYFHEMERQELSHEVRHRFLIKNMGNWFFTKTAKELAESELQNRVKETRPLKSDLVRVQLKVRNLGPQDAP